MKRQLLWMLLVISISIFNVVGCQIREERTVGTETENHTILEVYAGQSEEENLLILARAYEKMNADVSIQLHVFPDSEYTQQMMKIKNREAEADCIFFPNAGEAAIWENKKILKDVSSWYEGTEEATFYNSWYRNMEKDGSCYYIPYRIGKICVYYNKTLFDESGVSVPTIGWSWEDFKSKAKQLTGWLNNKKVYGTIGFENSNTWWMLPARTSGASDPFHQSDLEQFRKSAIWCHDFIREMSDTFPYLDKNGEEGNGYRALFTEGRLGMYFGESNEVKILNRDMKKNNLSFEYDVIELPTWSPAEKTDIYHTVVVSMAETTRHPKKAYEYIKFCIGEEGGKLLAQNSVLPAWQSLGVQQEYLRHTSVPEHAEYFLADCVPAETAVGVLHNAGIEEMCNEVAMYLMDEQELDYTFENVVKALKELKAR